MKMAKASILSARTETAGDKLRVECVGDYSVPDYQPEIRRILRVHTRVLPSGRYRRGGHTECAGLCVHTVLYSTDEGALATLDVTSEYGFSFPSEEGDEVLLLAPRVEGVSCRLGGPRRITVRCMLSLVPHVYAEVRSPDPRGLAALEGEDTVCLTHPIRTVRAELLAPLELALSDTRVVEGGSELLAADAEAEVTEAHVVEKGAEIKGEVLVSALFSGEGAVPYFLSHRIPFEACLPCEATEHAEVFAYPTVTALEARAVSGEGAGTRLLIDVGLELSAEVLTPSVERVVVDAFSLKSPLVARKESIPMTERLGVVTHRLGVECRTSRSESDSEDASAIVDLGMTVRVSSQVREGDSLTVRGDCLADAALLLCSHDADGHPDYATASFSTPFEACIELPRGLAEDAELEVGARALDVKGRLEAASLCAEGEIVLTVRATRRRTLSLAVGMQEGVSGQSAMLGDSELLAVYPTERESLWSLALKYRVSPERIAEQNGLPPEALESADLPSSIDGCARLLLERQ